MAEIMAATSTLNDFGLAPGVAPLPVTAVSPVPDVAPVMDVKPVAFDMDPVGGGANVVKVNEATALPRNVAVLRPAVQGIASCVRVFHDDPCGGCWAPPHAMPLVPHVSTTTHHLPPTTHPTTTPTTT